MMQLLLNRDGEIRITEDVVKAAATSGQERVLHLLKQRCAIDISDRLWIPIAQLYNAAKTGHEKVVRKLLVQGVDPDSKNTRDATPLWQAANAGHESVLRLLLDTQAVDVESKNDAGRTPLFMAASRGHKGIVRLLLEKGANPYIADIEGQTPLSMAEKNGQKMVIMLMQERCN
jgi:ankyrin repeat protein